MVAFMESYLQYGNIMERFLDQLLMDFTSILGKRVTPEKLIRFNQILPLIKRISKKVQSREEHIMIFLASKTYEISIMSILFKVFTGKFCLDENLLTLEHSMSEADAEFRLDLLRTIIPQIDHRSSLILEIATEKLVVDSLNCVLAVNSELLHSTLMVKFVGEKGRGPGVLREWILLQFEEMLALDVYFLGDSLCCAAIILLMGSNTEAFL